MLVQVELVKKKQNLSPAKNKTEQPFYFHVTQIKKQILFSIWKSARVYRKQNECFSRPTNHRCAASADKVRTRFLSNSIHTHNTLIFIFFVGQP